MCSTGIRSRHTNLQQVQEARHGGEQQHPVAGGVQLDLTAVKI